MSLPDPERGLVVKYGYLWHADARDGHQEGKDRPCLIVAVTAKDDGRVIASVAPITHSQPRDSDSACPVPQQTAHRLGLDHDQSWIVTTEVNRFEWPGAGQPRQVDVWLHALRLAAGRARSTARKRGTTTPEGDQSRRVTCQSFARST